MGAPVAGMEAGGPESADSLAGAFDGIDEGERSRHSAVVDYWRSIRGERDFPTIRDLDPLQISDAGPCSVLLELIGGGEDAEIRHIGETLKAGAEIARIGEAPRGSLLACIAGKLAIVAISRDVLAFEDEFQTPAGPERCRVTLLPFGSTGPWVDYVYGFVTSGAAIPADAAGEAEPEADSVEAAAGMAAEAVEDRPVTTPDPVEEAAEPAPEPVAERTQDIMDDQQQTPEIPVESQAPEQAAPEAPPPAAPEAPTAESPAGTVRSFDPEAGVDGFFGNVVNVELDLPATAAAAEQGEHGEPGEPEQPAPASPLHDRLEQARAKADEARQARLRSDCALREGLSAAYDFALDAEDQAEDYLKLVEARGLKIKLRSPMAPVVRLAFDGLCDEATIAELERVLAWALKSNLPRGSLAGRIEAEGGIAAIAGGPARDG